jgi:hypothetical protein
MRKRWSLWPLELSLAGVVAQDIWLFVLSGAARQVGAAAYVLQGLVLLISAALLALARRASALGWIS